jgi:hypothetical protein
MDPLASCRPHLPVILPLLLPDPLLPRTAKALIHRGATLGSRAESRALPDRFVNPLP